MYIYAERMRSLPLPLSSYVWFFYEALFKAMQLRWAAVIKS